MYCGNCGNKIKENSKFCPSCGAAVKAPLDKAHETVVAAAPVSTEKAKRTKRRMTNKLLCKLTVWPWVIAILLGLLLVFTGADGGAGIFLGTLAFVGGLMILVFGIWGLIRLARAKHRIATIIVILTIVVLIFQKVELIYDLSIVGLLISIIIGLVELNKLPDNVA